MDGKANAERIARVASHIQVPESDVTIQSGVEPRIKRVTIASAMPRLQTFAPTLMLALLVAGCAAVPPPGPPEGVPVTPEAMRCASLRESPAPLKQLRMARGTGWVVLEYSLDGSGKAVNPRLGETKNASRVSIALLQELQQAEFRAGVVRELCQEVYSFRSRPG